MRKYRLVIAYEFANSSYGVVNGTHDLGTFHAVDRWKAYAKARKIIDGWEYKNRHTSRHVVGWQLRNSFDQPVVEVGMTWIPGWKRPKDPEDLLWKFLIVVLGIMTALSIGMAQ